jgi:hypothetical protein
MRLRADRGTFLLCSGATYLDFPYDLTEEIARQFGWTPPTDSDATVEIDASAIRAGELGQQRLAFLLAKEHERDHFERYYGSPLGVLIYRCYHALTTTGNWLFQRFFVPGQLPSEVAMERPLKDWILSEGRHWIRTRVNDGSIPIHADQRAQVLSDLDAKIYPQLDLVSRFIDVLIHRGPPGFTMGQFATLANQVFEILATRGDVPWSGKWEAEDPDMALHPPGYFANLTTLELFELSAVLQESSLLAHTQADADTVEHWKHGYSEPPYDALFKLQDLTRLPATLLAPLVRTALQSPCDIVFNGEGPFIVESLHPTWRFHSLIRCLVDNTEFAAPSGSLEFRWDCLNQAGPSSAAFEQTLSQLSPRPVPTWAQASIVSGKRALFGPDSLIYPPASTDEVNVDMRRGASFAIDTFKACLEASARHDWDVIRGIRECILYCEEDAVFSGQGGAKEAQEVIGSHAGVVGDFLQLTIMLEGLCGQHIPPFTQAMTHRLKQMLGRDDLGNLGRWVDANFIAQEIFGTPFASALRLD